MEKRVEVVESDVRELKADMIDVRTRLAVAESNIKDIKEDISSIKGHTTWILRIIVGGFVGLLFTLIKLGGA